MKPGSRWDQLGFVAKVVVISTLIAIALKTVAPQLPIPVTPATSLAMVLTPACTMGMVLGWQLWTSSNANAPDSGRH